MAGGSLQLGPQSPDAGVHAAGLGLAMSSRPSRPCRLPGPSMARQVQTETCTFPFVKCEVYMKMRIDLVRLQ